MSAVLSRYNRKRWSCGYATRREAGPEITWSTTRAASPASDATADARCRPESITGYKMAACTVGRTSARCRWSWDRCEVTCTARQDPQFVGLASEGDHASFEQPSDHHQTTLVLNCVTLQWSPQPISIIVSNYSHNEWRVALIDQHDM